jgi:hypothetical protein
MINLLMAFLSLYYKPIKSYGQNKIKQNTKIQRYYGIIIKKENKYLKIILISIKIKNFCKNNIFSKYFLRKNLKGGFEFF